MRNRNLMKEARHAEYMDRAKELAEIAREGVKISTAMQWLVDVFPGWTPEAFEVHNPLPEIRSDYLVKVTMKRKGQRFKMTGRGNTAIAATISAALGESPIDLYGDIEKSEFQ